MEIHLKVIGILFILLSFIHFIFPSYFKWKEELVHLSLINRQLMYVHTFFIALVVFMIGLLCLTSSKDLMTTTLGRKIALGLTIFWGYSPISSVLRIFPSFVVGKTIRNGDSYLVCHFLDLCEWGVLVGILDRILIFYL